MAIIQNRKAYHNFEILEKIEAGIVLSGFEVKGVRAGHMTLDGAYVLIDRLGKLQLAGANIRPVQPENAPDSYVETRQRALLVHKKQAAELKLAIEQIGHTIIPLSVYSKEGLIKVEIALVKGKKKFDKRETLKKKDAQREIDRVFKR
jgi:SsrA-binding protein